MNNRIDKKYICHPEGNYMICVEKNIIELFVISYNSFLLKSFCDLLQDDNVNNIVVIQDYVRTIR